MTNKHWPKCGRYASLTLLLALLLALSGCDGDFFDGGHSGGGNGGSAGDYGAYWGTIETISADGYVPEMTQKPESPAPQSDQNNCPTAMILLLLLGSLWGWQRRTQPFPPPGRTQLA